MSGKNFYLLDGTEPAFYYQIAMYINGKGNVGSSCISLRYRNPELKIHKTKGHGRIKVIRLTTISGVEGDSVFSCRIKIDENGYVTCLRNIEQGNVIIKRRQGSQAGLFKRAINSSGMCLFCGEINFIVLQEHHPFPCSLPQFTVTLCANCHAKVHFFAGRSTFNKKGWKR